VGQWGTYITTPVISAKSATVNIQIESENDAKADATVTLTTAIYPLSGSGKLARAKSPVATSAVNISVKAGEKTKSAQTLQVANPKLWSPNTPVLYAALTTLTQDGKVVDSYETRFGIRTNKYDPAAGLFVNGEHFKLNGVCDHHDLGSLGTAVNVRALQRQLQILRDMGCNALRTSHNPPAPELLDFADQMGFLVMDEQQDAQRLWRWQSLQRLA
jgi:beta-galactosidase